MRKFINIKGNEQTFKFLVEYISGASATDGQDVRWCQQNKLVHLFEGDVQYYKNHNDWYQTSQLSNMVNTYIPTSCKTSKIKVYFPQHSPDTYVKNIRYMISANTWISGHRIDLGSYIFRRIDTLANESGVVKNGNDEYFEYVEFDILDPHHIIYSDDWMSFRSMVCNEPRQMNNTGSLINVSIYIVDEYDNSYIMKDGWIGSTNSFNVSNYSKDYMDLSLSLDMTVPGFRFDLKINPVYNYLLNYLYETYGLDNLSKSDCKFELIIKNKDTAVLGPIIGYNAVETYGLMTQKVNWNAIKTATGERKGMSMFFETWDDFVEGWYIVGSFSVYDNSGYELFNIVSNELPLSQDIFKYFVGNQPEKIIDINDMEFVNYTVVNKIHNEIIQLERPDNSKSNIIQPIFFKVKDTEFLTLHPAVTENICINLDDYKSKVEHFTLQVGDCKFKQIGANQYGILFKVLGNVIPVELTGGTYYILNEKDELVTLGKYKCVR